MSDCLFCKIVEGKIPSSKVYEDDDILAFKDIHPARPVHVLVIPKRPYVNYDHFVAEASAEEMLDFNRALLAVCEQTGLLEDGYRMITNAGASGMQEVPHMHMHILGGRAIGPLVAR